MFTVVNKQDEADTAYVPPPQPGDLLEQLIASKPNGRAKLPVGERPSEPTLSGSSVMTQPAPALVQPSLPVAVPPTTTPRAPVAAKRRATTPAKAAPRRGSMDDDRIVSFDEMFSDGALLACAVTGWLANGLATCLSIQGAFPPAAALGGFVLGGAIHYVISRIEMGYMSWRRLCSWYAPVIVGAVLIDAGTTSDGVRIIATTVNADVAHVPSVLQQLIQIATFQDISTWLTPAIIFAVIGTVMALLVERILRPLWRQFKVSYASWREQITVLEIKEERG